MREWLLYAPRDQLNEATRHYIDTIAQAARGLGRELRHVERLSQVPARADVLVVECKSAFKLRVARPAVNQWIWVQGIVPEEARLQFGSRWRQALWTVFERITLPRARGVLMVSQAMREHFGAKYGMTSLPVFLMPCANARLDPEAFETPGKYTSPSFVYAGSMHRWQCFGLTLEVFRRVRQRHPAATLTVLTGSREVAARQVAEAAVEGVTIDHVPQDRLQSVLRRFKYGLVLREPHVVNWVSTPTKVSSYMAAGVIPVMTDVVADFRHALAGTRPLVVSRAADADTIVDAVLAQEAAAVQAQAVREAYQEAFDRYFDHARYVEPLRSFLRSTGLEATQDVA